MGTIVALILMSIVVRQYGLAECNFSGRNGRFIVEDYCNVYQEYKDLEKLQTSRNCTDENKVWAILDRLYRHGGNGPKCMHNAIRQLGQTHYDSTTPSYCACSGSIKLDTYHSNSDIGSHFQQCFKYNLYVQLFETYFSSSGQHPHLQCQSHHMVWNVLAGITSDICRLDIVLHVADKYHRLADPCSCHDVNPEKSTVSSTMATTLTTKTDMLGATTSAESLVEVHMCNKASTIADVAHNLTIKHPNASDCATGDHSSSEALVLSNCNVGSANLWTKGKNVMEMCHRIPLYAPVATFNALGVYQPNGGRAGIFLGCIQDGFKVASQDCNHGVYIQHITKGGVFTNDPSNYYIIRW